MPCWRSKSTQGLGLENLNLKCFESTERSTLGFLLIKQYFYGRVQLTSFVTHFTRDLNIHGHMSVFNAARDGQLLICKRELLLFSETIGYLRFEDCSLIVKQPWKYAAMAASATEVDLMELWFRKRKMGSVRSPGYILLT